jgi:predicted dehydrogenase
MSTNRRTFLKAAAASAVLPTLLVRRAGAVQASDKITVGVIGVGVQGRGHFNALLNTAGVEVVGVSDVVKERLDNAMQSAQKKYADRVKAGTFAGTKAYPDFRDLLKHPGLDAVLIATPDHWHAIPCVLAARAGKHIYCEKPLTQNIADGRWVADEVKKAGVVFQTGSQQRSEYGNRFRTAVEAVWNGRIGALKTIRIGVGGPPVPCDLKTEDTPPGIDWDTWLGPAPDRGYNEILCPKGVHNHFPAWRNYRDYANGGLADMGAHHFDIAQWALQMDHSGPMTLTVPKNPERGAGLRYTYANGVVMIHNQFEKDPKTGKEMRADCVFEGTDGTIYVSRESLSASKDAIIKDPFTDKDKRVYPSNNHRKNWLDCIKAKKDCICTAETGHRTATICLMGTIAYRLGKNLKWDPATEKFDDAEANKLLSREPRAKWKV